MVPIGLAVTHIRLLAGWCVSTIAAAWRIPLRAEVCNRTSATDNGTVQGLAAGAFEEWRWQGGVSARAQGSDAQIATHRAFANMQISVANTIGNLSECIPSAIIRQFANLEAAYATSTSRANSFVLRQPHSRLTHA